MMGIVNNSGCMNELESLGVGSAVRTFWRTGGSYTLGPHSGPYSFHQAFTKRVCAVLLEYYSYIINQSTRPDANSEADTH